MCGDKTKQRCKTAFAACTKYEGTIPEFSELGQDDCNSIQDVAQDIYGILGDIRNDSDLSDVSAECFAELTDKSVKNFIQVIMDKICEMSEQLSEQTDLIEQMQQEITDLQENCGN